MRSDPHAAEAAAWKSVRGAGPAADIEYGPRYSPSWFGEAADTEARRVRLLRAVYRLADAGLVDIVKSEGGRLERCGSRRLAAKPSPN